MFECQSQFKNFLTIIFIPSALGGVVETVYNLLRRKSQTNNR